MAESWNLAVCGGGECFLLNKSRTLVRMNKRARVELSKLMVDLEEHKVPFGFTEGLTEIYFTFLRCDRGDYINDKIRLSCDPDSRDTLAETLTHELAHHLDDIEDISEREDLIAEKKGHAKFIDDRYAKKNVDEYLAVGFEVYYFGNEEARRNLKKHNEILFKIIKALDRKYRSI